MYTVRQLFLVWMSFFQMGFVGSQSYPPSDHPNMDMERNTLPFVIKVAIGLVLLFGVLPSIWAVLSGGDIFQDVMEWYLGETFDPNLHNAYDVGVALYRASLGAAIVILIGMLQKGKWLLVLSKQYLILAVLSFGWTMIGGMMLIQQITGRNLGWYDLMFIPVVAVGYLFLPRK
ncbi:MAG: hypothetical protein RI935_96 [Candidatus Parcubacteria bacterium]|jgi:predicted anti-sigma-YlaC factor YlaD